MAPPRIRRSGFEVSRRCLSWLSVAMVIFCSAFFSAPLHAGDPAPPELWLYYPVNLMVKKNVDILEPIWRRAAQAGYTHILLTDYKFGFLQDMPPVYFANTERVKKLAADLKLEIVPAVFSIGWSNNLLVNDVNLAEGLPVRDALFVVQNGQARAVTDPVVSLDGKPSWKDDCVRLEGSSASLENPAANARLVYKLAVPKFRVYKISVDIKTDNFHGPPEIKVLAGEKDHVPNLQYADLAVAPTQDWKPCQVVFNSLDHDQVMVYFGIWGGAKGKLQWRNWNIEETGLLNVLRRPGTPLIVRKEDGPNLTEGKDFEPVADPQLGMVPYRGEYSYPHEPPAIKTKLPDGTRLRVSFYHPVIIGGGSMMISLSEPKTLEVLRNEARRVHELFQARHYFMSHDEIRVFNWDASSDQLKLDAGPLLARNVKACTQILREVAPQAKLYIWSDMFDPFHNAHKDYYLVKGDLADSWEGLEKTTTIANWNFDKFDQSWKFFHDRGHPQLIAGYYDANPDKIKDWIQAANKIAPPAAVMYTTWQNKYDDLEAFAKACRKP